MTDVVYNDYDVNCIWCTEYVRVHPSQVHIICFESKTEKGDYGYFKGCSETTTGYFSHNDQVNL